MGLIERVDTRWWAIADDPPRVTIGPPIFPDTGIRVIPEVEYDRLSKRYRGAVLTPSEAGMLEVLAAEEVAKHRHPPHALTAALEKLRNITGGQ
jgi:hypothetical protein